LQRRAHVHHVAVLDVAAILAQMQGDAVGARLFGQQRRDTMDRDSGARRAWRSVAT
jgi:hypothetical protein